MAGVRAGTGREAVRALKTVAAGGRTNGPPAALFRSLAGFDPSVGRLWPILCAKNCPARAKANFLHIMGQKRNFVLVRTDGTISFMRAVRIRRKRFQLHRMFDEIKSKYCKSTTDVPILVTKEYRRRRYLVTCEFKFFRALVKLSRDALRS